MKKKIVKYLKSKKQLYSLLQLLFFIKNVKIKAASGLSKKYPLVIQFPITNKCNSKCVMCNVHKMNPTEEMSSEQLKKMLSSPLFKKVKAVGINGGEPTLNKSLIQYVEAILTLPKIKALNIISHGFNQKMLLNDLKEIYIKCKKAKVSFHVSISLDGVGLVHNNIRGLNVFDITASTIDEINNNKHKYCDSLDVGCTVIKQNINHLNELSVYAEVKNIDIRYRLGISNKRIESNKLLDDFSILNNEYTQAGMEFFYSQIGKEKSISRKFKYFSIYYFLKQKKTKRLLGCFWQENGVTLNHEGNIYYCAVESEKIGNLLSDNGESVFFSKENLQYRKTIIDTKCDSCIHDYSGQPNLSNILPFLKELFYRNIFSKKYRFLSKINKIGF